jgi:hypothetical protein
MGLWARECPGTAATWGAVAQKGSAGYGRCCSAAAADSATVLLYIAATAAA